MLRVAGVLVGTIQHHDCFRWQPNWSPKERYDKLRRHYLPGKTLSLITKSSNTLLEVLCAIISPTFTNRLPKGIALLNQAKVVFRKCCQMLTNSKKILLPMESFDTWTRRLALAGKFAKPQMANWQLPRSKHSRVTTFAFCLDVMYPWSFGQLEMESFWLSASVTCKGSMRGLFARPSPRSNAKGAMPRVGYIYLERQLHGGFVLYACGPETRVSKCRHR